MKATVLTSLFVIYFSSAPAMRSSFCVVLNTHRFLASIGSTTAEVPTVAIIGTFASAITSRIASAFGVVDGPISASILFSCTSFLMFCTARVVSPPSSSETYSTATSPILLGRTSPVFFCGMPIADVGPVAETINPILICAKAAVEKHSATTTAMRANTGGSLFFESFDSTEAGCTRPRRSTSFVELGIEPENIVLVVRNPPLRSEIRRNARPDRNAGMEAHQIRMSFAEPLHRLWKGIDEAGDELIRRKI